MKPSSNISHLPDYKLTEWNHYASPFASVTTSFQLELLKETAKYMSGDVVDLGCGTAKIAPLLSDQASISSYTGIDFSPEMCETAIEVISKLQHLNGKIINCPIEDYLQHYHTAALSINSYYSWHNPSAILKHISSLLIPGSLFILSTPNNKLDMPALLEEAEKELVLHPYFQTFKTMNLEFASKQNAHFVEMDKIIHQAHNAGFSVISCQQKFYKGGLNFLVLQKN